MTLTISPASIQGEVRILPSKSQLHRLLLCAALAEGETFLVCQESDAEDVQASIRCLGALGATIIREKDGLRVIPLQRDALPAHCTLPCGESGSTLRFLLPVVCALGLRADFQMEGRLPQRPLAPLDDLLRAHGCHLWREGNDLLCCEGQLRAGDFSLPGNISSQYISGLLFALPLLAEDSTLSIEGEIESANYIAMTQDALGQFGLVLPLGARRYAISGGKHLRSPSRCLVEGDWSNAAFWLCAGALSGGAVRCHGLHPQSRQGDRAICGILEQVGARLSWDTDRVSVAEGTRRGLVLDAAAIPDLVPALACVAALSEGQTRIVNAARLRLKESDRLTAVAQTLNALGAQVTEEPAGLCIEGVHRLRGGRVDAWGDHRIAMMAAIATCACDGPVTIMGAEAVNKSYPHFWRDLAALGLPQKEDLP